MEVFSPNPEPSAQRLILNSVNREETSPLADPAEYQTKE
jgi:hypothetical protein